MREFFSSDMHYFHKNIIKLSNRPFETIEDMHERMIANWAKEVKPGDRVWIVGDFSFGGSAETHQVMKRLPGRKILVQGNHDKGAADRFEKLGFEHVMQQAQIKIQGRLVNISHYPYAANEAEKAHAQANGYKIRYEERRMPDHGHWLIHGHVHGAWKIRKRMINVGVDVWNFKPVSLNELESVIARKEQEYANPENLAKEDEELIIRGADQVKNSSDEGY